MDDLARVFNSEIYGQIVILRGDNRTDEQCYVVLFAEPTPTVRLEVTSPCEGRGHQTGLFNMLTLGGVEAIITSVLCDSAHATRH